MSDGTQPVESVARKYVVLRPHLDERQRRLFLGAEAREFGRGGIKLVAAATGVHPDTIARGVRELAGEAEPPVRVRAPGGGRKSLAESDPGLLLQLKAFVDPETRGDPMSLLVWTTKSTRNLADALTKLGHRVSDRTVARMLTDLGFSLQGNTKVLRPFRDFARNGWPLRGSSGHGGRVRPTVGGWPITSANGTGIC